VQYLGYPEQIGRDQEGVTGVLIVNLGTPQAPDTGSVRRYLGEFLMDSRVVETTKWIWCPILHFIILTFRPAKSAKLYQRVWTEEGSPLYLNTVKQVEKLSKICDQEYSGKVKIKAAMRYGEPSMEAQILDFQKQGISRLVVLPLYPQYCSATVGSAFDGVGKVLKRLRWVPQLHFVHTYYKNTSYIQALGESIKHHFESKGKPEKLLLSYHGMPQKYIDNGDPYYVQCQETSRALTEYLGLGSDDVETCFQSRFGPMQWLTPSTDDVLEELARSGVKHVAVACPGFSSDCLETVDEIAFESKEVFEQAGGKTYHYIPALNDGDEHVQMIFELLQPYFD